MFLAAMIVHFKFEPIPGREPSSENPHSKMCICPQEYSIKVTTI